MSGKSDDDDGSKGDGIDTVALLLAFGCMVCAILAAWYARKWFNCKTELSKLGQQ